MLLGGLGGRGSPKEWDVVFEGLQKTSVGVPQLEHMYEIAGGLDKYV